MPKKANELSDKELRAIVNTGKNGWFAVGRVAGLGIQVRGSTASSWILRVVVNGKRRNIGLGGYPELSLSNARTTAGTIKEKIRIGIDPISERKAIKSKTKEEQAKLITFKELANEYIEKRSKDFKTIQQLRKLKQILRDYALPSIGERIISDINLNDIKSMLLPLWETKTETAQRLRIYVSHIFDAAIAQSLYTELNPARWDGGLKTLLPPPAKITKTQHHKALVVEDMAKFWGELTKREWMSAKALQFLILTAARSGEVRKATWNEINFNDRLWTIPAERMKAGKEHKVPLSSLAITLLKQMPQECEYIFPSTKMSPLTDVSISKAPKRIGYDVTAHGFRSTFKDWSRKYTNYADDVTELALAHVHSDSTRAAYARDELIEKRRLLMNDWSNFCVKEIIQASNITSLRASV
ncbi:site-specific integrase [uncultured Paraglaciecola sp.]|uniref:tyrosine-type recombinase/integrase n=1 Tax=uncultured Paraglaciecola sp. TaxID=1765024 RepID=UPI0025993110|nr:site-specific integrase [uncultured Paraglaciecola sp.]